MPNICPYCNSDLDDIGVTIDFNSLSGYNISDDGKVHLGNINVAWGATAVCNECYNELDVEVTNDDENTVSIVWAVEDVLSLDPTLTLDEARRVLALAQHWHDANIGISWDVLDAWIDVVKGERDGA